jgi:hypothetical protein
MRRNRCVDAVTDELRQAGIDFQIERNKHVKIRFTLNGRNEMCVVALSASDWRAHKQARSYIRRVLRQAAEGVRL